MTIFLVLLLLALVWLSGLGVTLLLFRRPEEAPRLIIAPFAGIATAVLLFVALLPLNLDALSTSRVELALLALLAAVGLWRSPLTLEDWREAKWPLIACSVTLFVAAWPLLWIGYRDYVGFGNPDVPDFVILIRYFANSIIRLPGDLYRGINPGVFLGVLTYVFQLSAVTGVVPERLFGTICAALVTLGPASVFLLCRAGLAFGRPRAALIAVIASVSAPPAFTFYLHSLGALTVVITVPAALGAALLFLRTSKPRDAFLLSLILSGALYNYGPGLAILLPSCGGALLVGMVQRKISFKTGAVALGIFLATVIAPCAPYLRGIFLTLVGLSSQNRLGAHNDEIQTSFALVLTERVIPFFWGLNNPYLPIPAWLGSFYPLQVILYSAGGLFFLLAMLAAFPRFSKLPAAFGGALAGGVAVFAFYQFKEVGYGVFKLVAWENLLFVTAFAACTTSLILKWQNNAIRLLLVALLAAYVGFNTAHTYHLGRYSAGLDGAMLSSTPGFKLSDFESLEAMPKNGPMAVGISDGVIRAWASAFYGGLTPNKPTELDTLARGFIPIGNLTLWVVDSTPMSFLPNCNDAANYPALRESRMTCADLDAHSFLDWKPGYDLVGTNNAGIWSSRVFTMTPGVPNDTLVLGRGWYRPEKVPDAPVAWQRSPFRWIRQRAEFMVIHPSPGAKRLRLGLVAGVGTKAGQRHIDLLMNGRHLQTIEMTGLRELLTEPFVIPGPLSQIELAIQESVPPLPRQGTLWNHWVPSDSRRLNVAVGRLELVDADPARSGLPSEVNFEIQAGNWGTATNGLFQDRWIGRQAQVDLGVPSGARYLEMRGFAPGVKGLNFPFKVTLSFGGEPIGSGEVKAPGDFQFKIPLRTSRSAGKTSIGIDVPMTFRPSEVGNSGDTRDLSIRINWLGFKGA